MNGRPRGRVDFRAWSFRVVGWDGLLPFFVASFPIGIDAALPDHQRLIDVVGVALPIVACSIRVVVGLYHIQSNSCSDSMKNVQGCAFLIGLFPLVLIDTMILLAHGKPVGALFATWVDWLALAGMVFLYLGFMTVAMYPGRTLTGPTHEIPEAS
jgi:hypothetical protein